VRRPRALARAGAVRRRRGACLARPRTAGRRAPAPTLSRRPTTRRP
jgi:hypothetical protein